MWVMLLDLMLLIGLIIIMVSMRKERTLTADRFALLVAGFWSFVDLSAILTLSSIHWQQIAFGGGLAIFQFAITYPLCLWFYRRFYKKTDK
jgi:hypothetical protein